VDEEPLCGNATVNFIYYLCIYILMICDADAAAADDLKFLFSQSWFLERVRQNQSSLQSSIDQMCQLVNNESFNTALKELKLLDPAPPGSSSTKQGPPVPKQKPEVLYGIH
jgi:hypothetical protein